MKKKFVQLRMFTLITILLLYKSTRKEVGDFISKATPLKFQADFHVQVQTVQGRARKSALQVYNFSGKIKVTILNQMYKFIPAGGRAHVRDKIKLKMLMQPPI